MKKNVDIDVVISFTVLIRGMLIAFRDSRASGEMAPIVKEITDALDEMIDCLKEIKEAK